MNTIEATFILGQIKREAEKAHMDSEAEALGMAISMLNSPENRHAPVQNIRQKKGSGDD